MTFALGVKSEAKLEEVHPNLRRVVERAIQICEVDFSVFEGRRSLEKQKANIATGVSWTLDGRHLTGHAVDLVPYRDVDGDGDCELSWDWPSCYKIAQAMQKAARELDVPIIWGGVWDKRLNDLSSSLESEVIFYGNRRRLLGKKVKTDGPHFELEREA